MFPSYKPPFSFGDFNGSDWAGAEADVSGTRFQAATVSGTRFQAATAGGSHEGQKTTLFLHSLGIDT